MKEIKVFLASSEEMEYDRLAFSDLIRKLDNIYEKRGVRIKLYQWEDFDASYNDKRKQDEYNEYIKQSDMFLSLFRTKAGKFTVEEFELAKTVHQEKGSPKPHVYCRDLYPGEVEDITLTEFKQKLFDEMGHFFAKYSSKDGLNLHFVMQLQLFENSRLEQVETDGTLITFCGEPIAKTDNIAFFSKNKDFIRMREDLQELNEDVTDLRIRLDASPEDERLQKRLQDKLNKRLALQEEFEHYRKQVLNIERLIIEFQGQEISETIRRAMEAFAEGEVNKADIILSEATQEVAHRRQEYLDSKETLEQKRKNLISDIEALLLKAETVLANTEKDIDTRKAEALQAYHEADETAKGIDYDKKKHIELLFKFGNFLQNYAYYKEAENVFLRVMSLCQESCGENEETASSYNCVGVVYGSLGDYEKALKYQYKALEIRKQMLGEEHADTATSYQNIGVVYVYLQKLNKALEYCNKALEIRKVILGEEHPDTADSYREIGGIHFYLGEYDQALKFSYKALDIEKQVLGEEHSATASSYNSIALIYKYLGNFNKALEYNNKVLEIRKNLFGEEHSDTATSYNNIGAVYESLGNLDKSLNFYKKALEIQKQILGDEHPITATSYNNMGVIYFYLGEFNKALTYHNKALEIRVKILGEEHPETIISYNGLGTVYRSLNKYEKALEYHNKALELRKRILGDGHPATATSYNNIGIIYRALRDFDHAVEYCNKALKILKSVFGEEHPHTATCYCNIGSIYIYLEDFNKSLEYYDKALEIQKKVLGDEHPDTQETLQIIAGLKQKMQS